MLADGWLSLVKAAPTLRLLQGSRLGQNHGRLCPARCDYYLVLGYPPPPRSFGIMGLAYDSAPKSRHQRTCGQNLEPTGLSSRFWSFWSLNLRAKAAKPSQNSDFKEPGGKILATNDLLRFCSRYGGMDRKRGADPERGAQHAESLSKQL